MNRIRKHGKKVVQRVVVFSDTYPFLGPLFWVLSIQYFIVQVITAFAWPVTYSWKDNFISDLGNTVCGAYSGLYVCSPLHALMNLSFIVFGITMALGAVLIYTEFRRSTASLVGFVLMSLAGFGTVLVGLFPENTINQVHMIGAFFGLVVGNASLLVLAYSLREVRRSFRIYTATTGVICLIAFGLFTGGIYLGLGRGGMERVVSYPFTVWMISFGSYMTAVRVRATMKARKETGTHETNK